MTLVAAWLLYPALLATFCLGIGLLVERLSGVALPSSLLLPTGFAASLSVLLTTTSIGPWPLGLGCLLLLTIAGLAWRDRVTPIRRRLAGDAWAVWVLPIVFAAYLLPVVATGTATFAGWIKLDDGATWLALGHRLTEAGRTLADLAPSTNEALLASLWGTYPSTSFAPLGLGALLPGVDGTMLIQPYLAFMAAVLASALLAVLRGLLRSLPQLRAAGVVAASLAALLYGYSMWGGIKELAIAPLIPAAAVAATMASRPKAGWAGARAMLPLAVLVAGGIAVGGPTTIAWFVVPLAWWLVAAVRAQGLRPVVIPSLALAGATLLLAGAEFIRMRPDGVVALGQFAAGSDDIGTLWRHLRREQVAGMWLSGDFRAEPGRMEVTWLLIALVAALAVVGLVWAVRRRLVDLPLYVCSTVPLAMVLAGGGAWMGGKALAIASPALLTAGVAGIGWLWQRQQRVVATTAGVVVAAGVVAAVAMTYREVWLAPRQELAELATIGEGSRDLAPALMIDYSPYGARYLLAPLDTQGAGELRRDRIPMLDGEGLGKGAYADIDEFRSEGVQPFTSLVLRRSVVGSRPPSNYELEFDGDVYQVWRRNPELPQPAERLPVGYREHPTAAPDCALIRELGRSATELGQGAVLVAAERSPMVTVPLNLGQLPEGWLAAADTPGAVFPQAPGIARYEFEVPSGGKYPMMLRGGFRGQVVIRIDGREVFQDRHRLAWNGNGVMGPDVELAAGRHSMELDYSEPWWVPGSGKQQRSDGGVAFTWAMGPIVFGPTADQATLVRVPPHKADSLCGRLVDWVEVLPPVRD